MTKEEAIKLIDDRMCFGRGEWSEHHKPEIDIYWQAGEMAIKALEAEPHWIPVKERLPEKDGAYLVTADGFPVTTKFYSADGDGWGSEWNKAITAWMPLPEPFKGVTE